MNTLYLVNTEELELAEQAVGGSPKIRRNIADNQAVNAPDGYAYVIDLAPPAYDSATHKVVRATPTLDGYGWEVVELTAEELATPVPEEVTNYQLKQALNETPADRQAVEALIAGSNDQNTIDGWQHASSFKATNPLFQGAVAYLGWSQEKVDALLIRASEFT
jgi:hypothetical protein